MRIRLVFTVAMAVLVPASARAQAALDRGSIQISGSASLSSSQTSINGDEQDRVTSIVLAPSALFFIAPGLAVGGELAFARNTAGDASSNMVAIGPAIAYYFGSAERTVHPFVGGTVKYARSSFEAAGGADSDRNNWTYEGSGGLLFLFTPGVGVSGRLYYRSTRQTGESTIGGTTVDSPEFEGDDFGLAFGITAFVF
jgi:hypothetical protein